VLIKYKKLISEVITKSLQIALSAKGKEFYCTRCAKYVLHDTYHFLGYCNSKQQIVPYSEGGCEHFEALDLNTAFKENGWLYCVTCRKPVYSIDELREHVGDILTSHVYNDEVASEESPSGD
jgi:hypothetical protein